MRGQPTPVLCGHYRRAPLQRCIRRSHLVPPIPRSALVLDFDSGPLDQVRPPRPLAGRPCGRSGQPGPRERPSCRGPAASRNGRVWRPWDSPSHFSRRPKFGGSGRILSTVRRPESGSVTGRRSSTETQAPPGASTCWHLRRALALLGTGVSWWQGVADQGDPGTVLGMADGARQPDDRDGRVALQRFAGFVRNVMVGRNGLSAEVLLELVAKAGGHEPRSHLATANLTFSASPELLEVIRAGIEDSIESVLGRREDVFVRSVASLTSAVRSDPFAEMMADDVYERCVTFVPTEPPVSLPLPTQTPRGDAVLFL